MGYTIVGNPQIIMQCNPSHLQLQILLALGHLCSRSNILQWIKNLRKLSWELGAWSDKIEKFANEYT